MALHRDIYWVGRQWTVTGYGMQACDQKQKSQFDIEIARLWDEDLAERFREQKWFNADDFNKGLAIARTRYKRPIDHASSPSPEEPVVPIGSGPSTSPPLSLKPEQPEPQPEASVDPAPKTASLATAPDAPVELQELAVTGMPMRIAGSAKFVPPWRVRLKR